MTCKFFGEHSTKFIQGTRAHHVPNCIRLASRFDGNLHSGEIYNLSALWNLQNFLILGSPCFMCHMLVSGARLVSYTRTPTSYYIPIISEKYRFGAGLVSEALHLLNYIGSRISEMCRFWWLLASEVSHLPLFLESPKSVGFITKQSGQRANLVFFTGDFAWPKIFLKSTTGVDLGRRLCAPFALSSCHDSCCSCSCSLARGPPSLSPPPPSPPFSLPPHFSFLLFIVVASWILCKLFLPIWLWACFYQVFCSFFVFFFFFVDVVSSSCCLCSQLLLLLLWLSFLLCVFSLSL